MRHLFCFALLCLLAACGGPAEMERTTIVVIPKGTTHEFWKSIHAGALRAARDLDVDIIWKGPLKEDDREAQIAVVEDFISRGVSGIVLAPLDDAALRVPVMNATRSGIPVIIIDSGLQSDDYISFVATDNYQGGRMAGAEMARRLEERGRLIVLRYQEGSASTMKREQGFLDAIGEYPDIVVISSNQHGGATTESAYQASENLLAPLQDGEGRLTIDGIFCPNESTTFGMLRALQDRKLNGQVRFVGFDSSPKLVEGLAAGDLDALVLQNPAAMGEIGVRTMVAHLNGEPIERRIDTGVSLVTRDNMTDPEIAALLEPPTDD
ncbi:MAG: substrate-binding domain-containing protein [Gemmatimonadetes bacterium]|jgi:ribose transport system substrate-binding protein|nr:substrate-binding domain-containing protein [Gemmatimonadota bacterium]MBT6148413.1 substrate-binding domain-containing protein [Gemmatimonadota bacterium]MBT7862800.1 substrate-binding domain-containing protein [Gemmatimonadota bacterium]